MTDETPTPAERWRKKPVAIDAVEFTSWDAVDQWLAELGYEGEVESDESFISMFMDTAEADSALIIHTLEGDMRANPGDWIIRGVQGEFYPCKPDIFAATYERETPTPAGPPRVTVDGGWDEDDLTAVAVLADGVWFAAWRSLPDNPCAGSCMGCGAGPDEPCAESCGCYDGAGQCDASKRFVADLLIAAAHREAPRAALAGGPATDAERSEDERIDPAEAEQRREVADLADLRAEVRAAAGRGGSLAAAPSPPREALREPIRLAISDAILSASSAEVVESIVGRATEGVLDAIGAAPSPPPADAEPSPERLRHIANTLLRLQFTDGMVADLRRWADVRAAAGAAVPDPPTEETRCWRCDGSGCEEGCGYRGGCDMAYAGPDSHRICSGCHGSGRAAPVEGPATEEEPDA